MNPSVIVAVISFLLVACATNPPVPTPTPTPHPLLSNLVCQKEGRTVNLRLHSINPLKCFKDDQLVLRFDAPEQIAAGEVERIPILVSRSVSDSDRVLVNYSRQKIVYPYEGSYGDVVNEQMITLADIPTNSEVVLKFVPQGEGRYAFFLPSVIFLDWNVRGRNIGAKFASENRGKVGVVCVGRPVRILVDADTKRTKVFTSVLLSASGSGVYQFHIVISKDGKLVESFSSEAGQTGRAYTVGWIPEEAGTYQVVVKGGVDCYQSTSEPLIIIVDK